MEIHFRMWISVSHFSSKWKHMPANFMPIYCVSKIIFQITVFEKQKFSYFLYILTLLSKSNIEMQMEINDYYLVSKTKYI